MVYEHLYFCCVYFNQAYHDDGNSIALKVDHFENDNNQHFITINP